MTEKNDRDLAERWFAILTRISSGPMRRMVANLLEEFGVDPLDNDPKLKESEVATRLIPDTPLQLTETFRKRLEYNLAQRLRIDQRYVEARIEQHGAELWATAKVLTQE